MSNTREDKVNTLGIVTIGVASVLLLWASIMALQAYYARSYGAEQARKNMIDQNTSLRTVQAEHLSQLKGYAVVDQKKARLRIPIDRAMKLVVRDLRDNAPTLAPAVGTQDQPTIPAVFGHPPDNVKMPAAGAPGAAAPAAGAPGAAAAAPAAGTKAKAGAPGKTNAAAPVKAKGGKQPAAAPAAAAGKATGTKAVAKHSAKHNPPGKAGATRHPRRKAAPAGATPRGGGNQN